MRLISIGSARRAHLFDIQTVEGNLYYWADAALASTPAALTADGSAARVGYQPWILTPPRFSFHRSMQTDTGSGRPLTRALLMDATTPPWMAWCRPP